MLEAGEAAGVEARDSISPALDLYRAKGNTVAAAAAAIALDRQVVAS